MAKLRLKDKTRTVSGVKIKTLNWKLRSGSHTGTLLRNFSGSPSSRAVATNVTGTLREATIDLTAAGIGYPIYVTLTATDANGNNYEWQTVVRVSTLSFVRDDTGAFMRDDTGNYLAV